MIGSGKLFLCLAHRLADRLNIHGVVNCGPRFIAPHEADCVFETRNHAFEVFIVHGRRSFFNAEVTVLKMFS